MKLFSCNMYFPGIVHLRNRKYCLVLFQFISECVVCLSNIYESLLLKSDVPLLLLLNSEEGNVKAEHGIH